MRGSKMEVIEKRGKINYFPPSLGFFRGRKTGSGGREWGVQFKREVGLPAAFREDTVGDPANRVSLFVERRL